MDFVRRFYRLAKACDANNALCNSLNWAGKGNAADYYGLAGSFGLEAHKNKSDLSMPQPDDILSYSGGAVCSIKPLKYCGHVTLIEIGSVANLEGVRGRYLAVRTSQRDRHRRATKELRCVVLLPLWNSIRNSVSLKSSKWRSQKNYILPCDSPF